MKSIKSIKYKRFVNRKKKNKIRKTIKKKKKKLRGGNFESEKSEKIDILIPWAGETNSNDPNERYNNELKYCLRSIYQYAKHWTRRVIVLMDGPIIIPSWLDEDYVSKNPNIIDKKKWILFLDRCTLFNNSDWCPTSNSFAVMANIQKIPNLSEKFIWLEDDMFFGKTVDLSDLFDGDKPFLWCKGGCWGKFKGGEGHPMYTNPNDKSIRIPSAPLSFYPSAHLPYPLLLSRVLEINNKYPELFDFISSHKKRWSPNGNSGIKTINDTDGDMEKNTEDLMGVYEYDLYVNNLGIFKDKDEMLEKKTFIESAVNDSKQLEKKLLDIIKYKPKFFNINDGVHTDQEEYTKKLQTFYEDFFAKKPNYEKYPCWNTELEKRLNRIDKKKLLVRNKKLGEKYSILKNLFSLIQKHRLKIWMTGGGLIMTVRHNGFIDFGGLEYQYGYDDDVDMQCMESDFNYIKQVLESNGFEIEMYGLNNSEFMDRWCTLDKKEFIIKKYPQLLNKISHFYIKYNKVVIADAGFVYNFGVHFKTVQCGIYLSKKANDIFTTRKYQYNDFFPLKKSYLYDSLVNIPNNYKVLLNEFYGDIFKELYIKQVDIDYENHAHTDKKHMKTGQIYAVSNGKALPVNIIQ